MIRSIRHKGLRKLYERGDASRLPPDMLSRIEGILAALDQAESLADMDRPSWRLHTLAGDLRGFHAVTVRASWRIIFAFDGDVHDVDFVDYH